MIKLVLDRTDPDAFEQLASKLYPMIWRAVLPFARDRMLSRTEDIDSLTNLCLLKLHQAHRDFRYEDTLTEEHNEKRFLALVRKYITNILIDYQYSANLPIRKPAAGLVSTAELVCDDDSDEGEEWHPVNHRQPTPCCLAMLGEAMALVRRNLDDIEFTIFSLLVDGYDAEGVARRSGISISRVRYLIYSRIQPVVTICLA